MLFPTTSLDRRYPSVELSFQATGLRDRVKRCGHGASPWGRPLLKLIGHFIAFRGLDSNSGIPTVAQVIYNSADPGGKPIDSQDLLKPTMIHLVECLAHIYPGYTQVAFMPVTVQCDHAVYHEVSGGPTALSLRSSVASPSDGSNRDGSPSGQAHTK